MRLLLSAALLLFAAPVFAQTLPGDPQKGRDLAMQTCSGCHFVAAGQRPPAPVQAPPFTAIARDPATTEFRLRNFLRAPHPIMPVLILSHEEADNVISFILSLKKD